MFQFCSFCGDTRLRRQVLYFGDGISDLFRYAATIPNASAHKRSERIAGALTMKKFLLGAVGVIAMGMTAPAIAADLPAAPYSKAPMMMAAMYDWSGLYIGANGGWGSSRKCWDENTGLGGTFLAADGCHNATGGVVGGQMGYRLQSAAFVYGVEVQGDWADLRGSNTSLIAGAPFSNQSHVNAFGLFTGQIGYAVNTALLYIKGGGALTNDRYQGLNTATNTVLDRVSETRWGGTVGAGVEYAFAPNWSAALEYDHLFMGTRTLDFYSTAAPGTFTREDAIRQNVDLVTVRINYRWGGPVIAKY
jgi:outer membrane immunogenic protein